MPESEFVLEIAHRVHYSNRDPIPIAEIASSLVALEKIIQRSRLTMSAITNIPVDRIDVYVQDIKSGSLTDDLIVLLTFGSKENMEAFLKKIHGTLEKHKVVKNALLGAIFMGVAGYGVYSAVKAMGSADEAHAVSVSNNVIINIAATESGIAPAQIEKIIAATISDKKANAHDAIEFVKPAKRDPSASISFDDSAALSITTDTIAKTPTSLKIDAASTDKFIPDVDLQIRATNLDSNDTGWAGLIPPLVTKRLRLVLGDGIAPKDVAGKFIVRADVIVHLKPQGEKKSLKPYQITLVRIIED